MYTNLAELIQGLANATKAMGNAMGFNAPELPEAEDGLRGLRKLLGPDQVPSPELNLSLGMLLSAFSTKAIAETGLTPDDLGEPMGDLQIPELLSKLSVSQQHPMPLVLLGALGKLLAEGKEISRVGFELAVTHYLNTMEITRDPEM